MVTGSECLGGLEVGFSLWERRRDWVFGRKWVVGESGCWECVCVEKCVRVGKSVWVGRRRREKTVWESYVGTRVWESCGVKVCVCV